MLIARRNAMMTGKRLPYDAEVEYLESTGTQWIDTGIYGGSDIAISGEFLRTIDSGILWGSIYVLSPNSSTTRCMMQLYKPSENSGCIAFYTDTSVQYVNFSPVYNTRFSASADLQTGVFTVETTSKTRSVPAYSMPVSLYMFARHRYFATTGVDDCDGICPRGYRIYLLQIRRAGNIVRDFIPVRKGTVGYLYDRVSGKLFGNAGTGDFGYGNDLKYPIPAE